MSDIIVRGMKMPKNCAECPIKPKACVACLRRVRHVDEELWIPLDHRHHDCPLISIPTPHGRLIDADALRVLFADWYRVLDDNMREEVALRYIDNAPTAIKAED